jgi:CDP-diacylglycerol--glycerol-3-phosphate 3-phosphatidyltransferase
MIIVLLLFPFYTVNINFPTYLINNTIIIDSKYIIAGILFMIASVTDFLDGYIARKYNLVTDFGKFMDSIADKILVNSMLIILSASGFISPIITVVIIVRDSIINSIRMIAASKGKVISAISSGKMKTACLMVGIILTLFYNLPFELWNIKVSDFLLITATILSLISGVQYYVMNRKLLYEKDKK